jgi:ankyrin repeat protein
MKIRSLFTGTIIVMLAASACSGLAFSGEIHTAAAQGDLAKAKALLQGDPNLVFSFEANGFTPLYVAVLRHQKEMITFLLADNADANFKNKKDGDTALHAAAGMGYTDLMEVLLANKADVNAKNNDGVTPLHMAAMNGRKEAAELLLTNKADVNAKDKDGKTPLQCTQRWSFKNYKDTADLLRQHGGHE